MKFLKPHLEKQSKNIRFMDDKNEVFEIENMKDYTAENTFTEEDDDDDDSDNGEDDMPSIEIVEGEDLDESELNIENI